MIWSSNHKLKYFKYEIQSAVKLPLYRGVSTVESSNNAQIMLLPPKKLAWRRSLHRHACQSWRRAIWNKAWRAAKRCSCVMLRPKSSVRFTPVISLPVLNTKHYFNAECGKFNKYMTGDWSLKAIAVRLLVMKTLAKLAVLRYEQVSLGKYIPIAQWVRSCCWDMLPSNPTWTHSQGCPAGLAAAFQAAWAQRNCHECLCCFHLEMQLWWEMWQRQQHAALRCLLSQRPVLTSVCRYDQAQSKWKAVSDL